MESLVLSKDEFYKIDRLIQIKASRAYQGKPRGSFDTEDLYQEGWLAFLESWAKFESRNDAKFMTYAYRRMAGAMVDLIRYMLTGIKHQDKTGERKSKREIYFDDDPAFDRSEHYAGELNEHRDWLIDCDIFLSRIGEKEKVIFFRYYVCDDPFQKIAPDVGVSWQTVNRIVRRLDADIACHLYRDVMIYS